MRPVASRHPGRVGLDAPLLLIGGLVLAGAVLGLVVLADALPPWRWPEILSAGTDMDVLVVRDAVLPRMAAALVAGALLGAAGVVFQQVLRNPLASPDTLGAAGGGDLALAAVTLLVPHRLGFDRTLLAFAGGLGATALVLALAARSRFAAGPTLLTGLAVTLLLNAATTVLVLLRSHDLSGLMVWMSGSLAVQDWRPVWRLAWTGMPLLACLALLLRSLSLFAMGDGSVRALGGRVPLLRFGCLALAVGQTAAVAGSFGTVGFIGLLAPTLARLTGVRRSGPAFAAGMVIGACLLWVTDEVAMVLSRPLGTDLPAGALTALIGTPLLVALAFNQRSATVTEPAPPRVGPASEPLWIIACLVLALLVLGLLAVLGGRNATGWTLTWPGPDLDVLLPWRLPRTAGAAGAGALLGMAGAMLQRVSGNPLASPEMLGLSAGAGAGLLIATLAGGEAATRSLAAVAGAIVTAGLLLGWMVRFRVEPGRLLVVGLALTSLVGTCVGILMAIGEPHAVPVMAWLAGSTYRVTPGMAAVVCGLCVPALFMMALATRWLDLMALGAETRQALGLDERRARACLVVVAAVMAGCGTLIVGPISFVGLVVPQMASAFGLRRAGPHGLSAGLAGAVLMVTADALARTVAFPWQMPSGLVAALVGSPILLALLLKRARSG